MIDINTFYFFFNYEVGDSINYQLRLRLIVF